MARQFITRFKKMRHRCWVNFLDGEFVKLAQNGLDIKLEKKFKEMEFYDLFELDARVAQYEAVYSRKKSKRKVHVQIY